MSLAKALQAGTTHEHDFVEPYVEDLGSVLDMDAIAGAGLKIGADPLGGASADYWAPIAERYGLSIEVVNAEVDPTFSFMTLDHDGKIRMDCSSPYAMAGLIGMKDRFDIAFGNDPDADRHGIVTRGSGPPEPEPLPRGGHLLSLPEPSRLARGRRGGQDPRLQLDDRPRGREPRPAPGRGPGGLQVVRGRTARRQLRLRRRGERGGLLPPEGRHGLDDGQGRDPPRPPRLRDPGPDRQGPRRDLRGAGRPLRQPRLREDRRSGHARPEGRPGEAVRPRS